MRRVLFGATLLCGHAMAAGVLPAPVVTGTAAGTFAAGNDVRFTTLTSAAADGATDDSAALAAALTTALPMSGVVTLQNKQYYLGSSITIPQHLTVTGAGDPGGDVPNWNPSATRPMLILGPGATINLAGTLSNVVVVRAGVSLNPKAPQDVIQNVASYSGTGVTMTGPGTLDHVILLGHAQAVDTNNTSNWRIRHIRGDNLAGLKINGMHDWSWFEDVEWMPMLSPGNGLGQFPTAAVAGVADNGSGLLRVTTSTAHGLATGNTAVVYNVGGYTAANGRWPVTVIDSTHFDLQGSASAPSLAATTTLGSATVQLGSAAGLAVGQGVSGTGVPAGATITAVALLLNQVTLSASATATGSTTLAISNPAYTSGGSVTLNTTSRPGPCLSVLNSESPMGTQYQCFGYDLGVSLGAAASWTTIYGLSLDDYNIPDPGKTGIAISGTAMGSKLHVGYLSSEWTPLQVNTTANATSEPQLIEGGSLYSTAQSGYGPPGIQLLGGNTLLANDTCQAGKVFVASTAGAKFSGGNCLGATWSPGSVLSNVAVTNTEFGDISGNTLRGSSVALAVPNAAGSAFVPSLQVQASGTVLVGQGTAPPLQVSASGLVQIGNPGGSTGGSALHINNVAAFDPNQGGQFEMTNATAGNPAPHKYLRVDSSGRLQVVSSGYSATLLTIDDTGNLTANGSLAGTSATVSGASPGVTLNGAAGVQRQIAFQTAASPRWLLAATNTAESGSNAGSNLALQSFTDGGALLSTVMTATRATGAVAFGGSLSAGGHVINTGPAPTLSGCGTAPTLSATASDRHGTVTPGSGASACVVTFNTAYGSAPDCMLVPWAAGTVPYVAAVTTASLTVGFAASGKISYACEQ